MGAIVIFFLVAILFWGAYEQAGSTLNLFADRYTRLTHSACHFPRRGSSPYSRFS
jgi:dipeptide/tripeptide permease